MVLAVRKNVKKVIEQDELFNESHLFLFSVRQLLILMRSRLDVP